MKISISDVKIGDRIHVFDMSSDMPLVYSVDVEEINEIEPGLFVVKDGVPFEIKKCSIFTDLTECIDLIRTSNFIRDFDEHSMYWYHNFIKQAIDEKQTVYVIRERRYNSKEDRYLDECYIKGFYYDGIWKIKTQSKDKYITTMHHASSLGLRIFFNKDNAIAKLSTLKGGLN